MWYVIALRLRSARRVVAALGRDEPLALLAVLVVAAIGLWRGAALAGSGTGAWMLAAVACVPAWLAHLGRTDERLLRDAALPVVATRAAEYLLLAAPWSAALLLSPRPAAALPPLAIAVLLAAVSPDLLRDGLRRRRRRARPVPLLPSAAFEAIAGVRRRGPVVALLWLLAIPLSRVPSAALVLGVVVAFVVAELQGDGEGRELVRAFGGTPAAFLRRKLLQGAALYAAAVLPIVLLLLARHPAWWPGALLLLWVGAAAQGGPVLLRYAVRGEGRRPGPVDTLLTLTGAGGALLPPVLPLLMLPLWRRAERALHAPLGGAPGVPAVEPLPEARP